MNIYLNGLKINEIQTFYTHANPLGLGKKIIAWKDAGVIVCL